MNGMAREYLTLCEKFHIIGPPSSRSGYAYASGAADLQKATDFE